MNFRVGQKVVCVDANCDPNRMFLYSAALVEGEVYTIREILNDDFGVPGVFLEEVIGAARLSDGKEFGFYARRFRPLVERKTDTGMAILKSVLDEVNAGKVREIADA